MVTKEHYQLLRRTIKYGREHLGLRVPSSEDIGKSSEGVLTLYLIEHLAKQVETNAFQAVDLFGHFSKKDILKALREIEYPEYTLEYLVSGIRYIQRRNEGQVPLHEEQLRESLESMEKKYGKKRVKNLKERLGL